MLKCSFELFLRILKLVSKFLLRFLVSFLLCCVLVASDLQLPLKVVGDGCRISATLLFCRFSVGVLLFSRNVWCQVLLDWLGNDSGWVGCGVLKVIALLMLLAISLCTGVIFFGINLAILDKCRFMLAL